MSGPMRNFKLQAFLDSANEMVRADEVSNALWLLEKGIPAWYREHTPIEVINLKNEIMRRLATPSFYARDRGSELQTHPEVHKMMKHSLRGDIIVKEMRHLNNQNLTPALYDFGPGEYWTPKLLIEEKAKFIYVPIWVNEPSYKHYLKDFESAMGGTLTEDMPKVFYACEIIEHMWKEDELRYEMNRNCGYADIIHFSTPAYTFDTECQDWMAAKKDLGHLRAYTPSEFFLTIQRLFPEYNLVMFNSDDIHLHVRGVLRNTKFELANASIQEIFK